MPVAHDGALVFSLGKFVGDQNLNEHRACTPRQYTTWLHYSYVVMKIWIEPPYKCNGLWSSRDIRSGTVATGDETRGKRCPQERVRVTTDSKSGNQLDWTKVTE